MKNTLLSMTFCLTAGVAFAGGMGPVKEEPNWAGFYVGVNSGFYVNNAQINANYLYVPGANFSKTFGNAVDNASIGGVVGPLNVDGLNAIRSAIVQGVIPAQLGSSTTTGYAGGLQVGYNWQRTVWVYGVEADFQWFSTGPDSGFSGVAIAPAAAAADLAGGYASSGHSRLAINWLSTERLRLGYAYGALMPYITGGFAFGNTFSKAFYKGTDLKKVDIYSGSYSSVRPGWSAGGGLEYEVASNWLTRIEALYYDLGTVSYAVFPASSNAEKAGLSVRANHHFEGVLVRLGVNYLF